VIPEHQHLKEEHPERELVVLLRAIHICPVDLLELR